MGPGAPIGIIGYGAIGRDLANRLLQSGHPVTVLLRSGSASCAVVPAAIRTVHSVHDLIDMRPPLVVEAAGQAALESFAPVLLSAGIDVVAASTGALADPAVLDRMAMAARRGASHLVIPAGALGGLDYLAALRDSKNAVVRYTSRKPPAAWRSELLAAGHDPTRLSREVLLFEGTAAEAARLYPRNLNAALTVALAAAPTPVTVRVVADPTVELNTHEIEAESDLGSASMRFANTPSLANPKTSALTAASLAAVVRRLLEPVVL